MLRPPSQQQQQHLQQRRRMASTQQHEHEEKKPIETNHHRSTNKSPTIITYYSQNRHDRSGAVVHDMMWVHAYAYHMGGIYGGACSGEPNKIFMHQNVTQQLLDHLGWNNALMYNCPTNYINSTTEIIVSREFYLDLDASIFTPQWKQYFQQQISNAAVTTTTTTTTPGEATLSSSHLRTSLISSQSSSSSSSRRIAFNIPEIGATNWNNNDDDNHYKHLDKCNNHDDDRVFSIAVHIRRGDVDPCTYMNRYLPNEYYMSLIQEYIPPADVHPNVIVNIYSESDTYEAFDIFSEKGYNVLLDESLHNVWKALSTADIAMLSKSSFSYVPAIINPNIVVYTAYRHAPLPSWSIVEQYKSDSARHLVQIMHDTNCTNQNSTSIEMKRYQYTNHHNR